MANAYTNRQFASSQVIRTMVAVHRQLASSQVIGTMAAVHRQLASSQVIAATAAVHRQLASSQVIAATAAVHRQLASSQVIAATAAVHRQLASSQVIAAMATVHQQLVSSRVTRAMVLARWQLPYLPAIEKMTSDRRLASTLIAAAKKRPESVGELKGSPRVALAVVGARESPQRCMCPYGHGLVSGHRASCHEAQGSLVLFDQLVTEPVLRHTCRKLFAGGHYAIAVEKAFVCLNNEVKDRSGLTAMDGVGLMFRALSEDSPVLKLNALRSESEKNEQAGFMHIFAGSMRGIRNPRAHEPGFIDDPRGALELLAFANHLMRKLQTAHSDNGSNSE